MHNGNNNNNGQWYTFAVAILNLLIQILAIVQLVAVLLITRFTQKQTGYVGSDVQTVLMHVKDMKETHTRDMVELKKDIDFYFYFFF